MIPNRMKWQATARLALGVARKEAEALRLPEIAAAEAKDGTWLPIIILRLDHAHLIQDLHWLGIFATFHGEALDQIGFQVIREKLPERAPVIDKSRGRYLP